MPKKRTRRNGNGRTKVSTSPKGPSQRPSRSFNRTFRGVETVELNNSNGETAYVTGKIEFNPAQLSAGNEFQQMAACFEMYRVRRARVFIQPAFESFSPTTSLALNSAAASTVWTVSDYTNNETIVGSSDIKNYQNARFHTLSLNSLKKIVDTPVRMYRKAGTSGLLSAGVMPASYWLDTSFSQPGTFSCSQYCIELPGFDNAAVSLRPRYRFIFELDVEFKQPGTSVLVTTFSANQCLGALLRLGTYPNPPIVGGFVDYTVIGYKSQEVAGSQVLTFRLTDGAATPTFLNVTASDLRQVIADRTYLGQDAQWTGPSIPDGL